jgi:hypothetical protein
MKTSFRSFILLTGLITLSFSTKAQNSTSYATPGGLMVSVAAESSTSLGKFKDDYKWMAGGSLQADIPLFKRIYVSINAGYDNYFGKNYVNNGGQTFTGEDLHLLPVMAGLKTFWTKGFYTEGLSGAGFALNKNSLGYSHSAAFIYVQQIGYQFRLTGRNSVDAGVRYEGSSRFSQADDKSKINSLGLSVAYTF